MAAIAQLDKQAEAAAARLDAQRALLVQDAVATVEARMEGLRADLQAAVAAQRNGLEEHAEALDRVLQQLEAPRDAAVAGADTVSLAAATAAALVLSRPEPAPGFPRVDVAELDVGATLAPLRTAGNVQVVRTDPAKCLDGMDFECAVYDPCGDWALVKNDALAVRVFPCSEDEDDNGETAESGIRLTQTQGEALERATRVLFSMQEPGALDRVLFEGGIKRGNFHDDADFFTENKSTDGCGGVFADLLEGTQFPLNAPTGSVMRIESVCVAGEALPFYDEWQYVVHGFASRAKAAPDGTSTHATALRELLHEDAPWPLSEELTESLCDSFLFTLEEIEGTASDDVFGRVLVRLAQVHGGRCWTRALACALKWHSSICLIDSHWLDSRSAAALLNAMPPDSPWEWLSQTPEKAANLTNLTACVIRWLNAHITRAPATGACSTDGVVTDAEVWAASLRWQAARLEWAPLEQLGFDPDTSVEHSDTSVENSCLADTALEPVLPADVKVDSGRLFAAVLRRAARVEAAAQEASRLSPGPIDAETADKTRGAATRDAAASNTRRVQRMACTTRQHHELLLCVQHLSQHTFCNGPQLREQQWQDFLWRLLCTPPAAGALEPHQRLHLTLVSTAGLQATAACACAPDLWTTLTQCGQASNASSVQCAYRNALAWFHDVFEGSAWEAAVP